MLTFLDHTGNEFGVLSTFKTTDAVNGERSITGTIHGQLGVERGWKLRHKDEYYAVIFAKPKNAGKKAEVEFDAVHQFFWDFDKSSVYTEMDGSHQFTEYLDFIFNGSGYRYNLEVEVGSLRKQNFGLKKRLELFYDLVKHAGVEFQVRGRVVRILEKTGTDLSTVVRRKLNLQDLTIEKNIGNFVTYVKGLGAWKDEQDKTKGRLEVEYISPLALSYGRLEAEPYIDERFTNADNFKQVLKKRVEDSYTISVQLTMEDLNKAGYRYTQPTAGDYITVIDEDNKFKEKVRIVSFETEYDVKGQVVDHKVTCNDIGSVKKQVAGYNVLKNNVANVSKDTESALKVANRALVSADGKSTVYFGTEFPQDVPKGTLTKGDTLYLTVGDTTKMYYWNGAEWIEPPVVNDVERFKRDLAEEIAQVNTTMQAQSEEHDRQVADILSKTQFVESLANQAKSDATNALASAAQLKADAVSEAQRLVNTLKTETVASSNRLKQQIDTIGNQLSSQQAELLQATQTVRGLDTQVKSVANQLGTQQTTITQLVNDGNARGQKIADFETSLDGVTTKLQNLWNGSRNLLSNTELLTGYEGVLPYPKNHYLNKAIFRWTHRATDTVFQEGLVMQVNDTLVNPKEMILSFYAVANRSTTIRCYMFNPNGRKAVETSTGYTATNVDGYAEVTISTAWKRYWVRYTYQVGYVAKPYVIIGRSPDSVTADSTVSIVAPALYHGHYNRDWQPSDVDITSDFATYKQTIDQNLAQLGSDIRTANGSVTSLRTEYNQTKAEIALLASKSDFDALTQKTQSLEASLKVQAGKIDLKAEKTLIDTINQQISSTQAELTVVNDAIAQRVTKTDFNAVKRTAEANATAITQVNNAIELRAEKTYVEGVKSTADNALAKANANANTITQTKAELKIANDAIETKATKVDLNNLTGRMSNAETTIRTQAGLIEQRLTSTQVESAINSKGYQTASQVNTAITGKGYQTKSDVDNNITGRGYITSSALQPYALATTVQTLVRETADSFSRTISETKALIPTEIERQNLYSVSKSSPGYLQANGSTSLGNQNVANKEYTSDYIEVTNGQKYTFQLWVTVPTMNYLWRAYQFYDANKQLLGSRPTWNEQKDGYQVAQHLITVPSNAKYLRVSARLYNDGKIKVEKNDFYNDWTLAPEDTASVTALHDVKDTVSSHTRTIGAVGTTGSILDNVSKVTQTAAGLVQEVSGTNGLKTQVSQLKNSWAVKISGPEGLKTAINASEDGVRLLGKNIRLDGNTLIDNGVIKEAMIGDLSAGKITSGTLDAARIKANSIDGSKIAFDQAFFNGLTANEAYLKQLFAKNAFITQVQAVALSASQISSGVIKATNGAMLIDLDNALTEYKERATIRFHSAGNVLYREKKHPRGHNTIGALMFKDSNGGGVMTAVGNTSHQTIDTMRNNYGEGGLTGSFAGIRVVRDDADTNRDRVDIIADRIIMAHSTDFRASNNSGFYFYPTAVNGWWNIGRVLQVISDKFRDHGWGEIGNIYNLNHSAETNPTQYT
ncbi:gp58-like family protein [Streptococcus suis]|uniref:phage tail protein n=1 Tax=Streptococcus suis TaxID=1307 RepID=UPI0024127781|nr:phage tail protein [Streptococcus suis]MDG4506369.1 gp58-like family protein [Streptococcus suis]